MRNSVRNCAKSGAYTAVNVLSTVLMDVTLRSHVETSERFGETCCFHIQDRINYGEYLGYR